MLSNDMKKTPHTTIADLLHQLDGTYFRVIPRDIVRIVASMLTVFSATQIKSVSSNRLCGAEDFMDFLAIDHKYRRYIMYGRKCRERERISEYRVAPAKYDHNFYTVSGEDVQRLAMESLIDYPKYTVNGIRTGDLCGHPQIIQFTREGNVKTSEPINIDFTFGDGRYSTRERRHGMDMRYSIGCSDQHVSVKIDNSWEEDWIVDPIHHANYINHDGHSRRTLVVMNMLTGERVFQAYGETATMIARLQNYWVTLNVRGAIATVYSEDSRQLLALSCEMKGCTQVGTRLAVGTDPDTFVVVQEIYIKGGWFRKERHEKWVSVYQVYEHIVFG